MKLINLLIISFLLFADNGYCQNTDSVLYQLDSFVEFPFSGQTRNQIILYIDSTFRWIDYFTDKTDSFDNYLKWEKSEKIGIWTLSGKRTLILKFGDIRFYFKKYKNTIKTRNLIKSEKGNGYLYRQQKRISYKMIKQ
ncbi:MAG: hypothetical protein A2W84_00005 [Bacteroidetes bacterium GWC2_40_13]|nr:MAG: hypothetical protein A2W84_00005 [Bacteroidetes bacterium GWC2_40_13]